MNLLDVILVAILAYAVVRGTFRGIIKEVASLAGVFVGFYVGYSHYTVVAGSIRKYFTTDQWPNLIGFFIMFILAYLAVSFAGVAIRYILRIAHLGLVDRILGGIFGFAKGLLIAMVVVYALTAFLPKQDDNILKKSLLAPHTTSITQTMNKYVTQDMRTEFYHHIEDLKRKWAEEANK
ncbi:MAG: CvpA family protein [Proteobacteria bacterium]|nr:CvpA family protein [Pseudomonadota bacterium]